MSSRARVGARIFARRAALRPGRDVRPAAHAKVGFNVPVGDPAPEPDYAQELLERGEYYGLTKNQLGLFTAGEFSRPNTMKEDELNARYFYGTDLPENQWQGEGTCRTVAMARAATPRGYSMGVGPNGPMSPPPDLPSLLLNSRICYLGMPLVPAVTELIIAELLFLGYDNAEKPMYFYVNSAGSQQGPDRKTIAFETEAYAIMDTMRYITCPIETLCVGKAWGNAAMLLAAGNKGKRYSLPNASIQTCPPRLNRSAGAATDVMIKANELEKHTNVYVNALAHFTGKSPAVIRKDTSRTRYFTPEKAVEYGLIDHVLETTPGQGGKALLERKDYDAMLQAQEAQMKSAQNTASMGASGGPQAG